MHIYFYIILTVNCIVSILYAIFGFRKRRELMPLLLVFLLFPVLGLLFYAIPALLLRRRTEFTYDKEAYIRRLEVEKQNVMPDKEKELNVVPVKDAMAISSNLDKRTLLLEQLKQDIYTGYKDVLAAGNDRDSESAHYVASAKMEVQRQILADLSVLQAAVSENPDDAGTVHQYLKQLAKYINSSILSAKESEVYKKDYCRIYEDLKKLDAECVPDETENYILYLIDLKEYDRADYCWGDIDKSRSSEGMFFAALKLYYMMGDKESFTEVLQTLESSSVELSEEGLTGLRYWRDKCYQ